MQKCKAALQGEQCMLLALILKGKWTILLSPLAIENEDIMFLQSTRNH